MSNALTFVELKLRNFLSFGSKEIVISLRGDHITVVLGENWDTGGEDSRNGCGKSAIIDALCYALFGKVVRGISNQKLINKLSQKGSMIVSVQFNKGDYQYLVERTERPSKLFLLRKPIDDDADFKTKEGRQLKYDISRGKNETTEQIIGILGFDITLFEYLVANTSESTEFLKLTEEKRRDVIEHLFGFTIMTEKAKLLKEERKEKNKELIAAESATEATKQANERIEAQIRDLEAKSKVWDSNHASTIKDLTDTINAIKDVDVENEIEMLKLAAEGAARIKEVDSETREIQSEIRSCQNEIREIEQQQKRDSKYIKETEEALEEIANSTCPTCKQHWAADQEYKAELETGLSEALERNKKDKTRLNKLSKEIDKIKEKESTVVAEKTELQEAIKSISEMNLVYKSVEEAASAGATLKGLREQLASTEKDTNPHTDSIISLREKAIQKIDDKEIKNLRSVIDHYNFLIDLLTKKDSFLRKLIIDRWLPILNKRIAYWLEILELPHTVKFQPDLTVEIMDYHEEFDFGNLSKGERNRVRIALNFAFQDVFSFLNYSINILMVDELLDNGICSRGAENAVGALKQISSSMNKRIFLTTHRDDIAARVDDIIKVVKENRLSRIIWNETS